MTTLTNGLNLFGGGTARGYQDAVTTIGNRITGYPISHDEAIYRLLGHLNFSGTLEARLTAFEDRYGAPFHLADPDTLPNLILDFAARDRLDDIPGWSYSRTGPASYVDGSGKLVIDRPRTNWALNSESMASWSMQRTSIIPDKYVAPDGTLTADEVASDGTASSETEYATGPIFPDTLDKTQYTVSCFVKSIGKSQQWVRWAFKDSGTGSNVCRAYFDIVNGVKGTATVNITDHGIEACVDGWYRIWITGTTTTTGTDNPIAAQIEMANGDNDDTLDGNLNRKIAIWGIQVEEGATLTDYIKTGGSAVTAALPRLDHDPATGEALGLLVEETSTNLVQYSEDFSQAYWTKRNGDLTTGILAPDGTTNAVRFEGTGTDAALSADYAFQNGFDYTLSCWLRCESGTMPAAISYNSATFPAGDGDGGRTKSITLTDEWQRFTFTSTANASGTYGFGIGGFNALNDDDVIFAFGVQLEVKGFPTSYIPTAGATETRGPDLATITDLSNQNWWNVSEGSALIQWSHRSNLANSYLLEAAVDTSNRIGFVAETSNRGVLYLVSGGSVVASPFLDSGPLAVDTDHKFAGGWKANDSRIAIGGTQSALVSTGNPPTGLTDLHVGDHVGGGNSVNGHIKSIAIWDNRRPDAELEALTE